MKRVLFSLLITVGHYGFCQDTLSHDALIPKSVIKYSPLHLVNHYPSIQFAYEFALAGQWTAQFDAGYVIDYGYDLDEFKNKRGFKLKAEPRYYFDGKPDKGVLFYFAAEFYGNRINFDRTEVQQECFDLGCNHRYTREYDMTVKYRELGSTVKFGRLKWYRDIVFDFNFGLSLRYIRYHHPIGTGPVDTWFAVVNEDDRTAFGPHLSVRIGYRLK